MEVRAQRLTLGMSRSWRPRGQACRSLRTRGSSGGELGRPTLDRLCRAARAVGLAPSLSFYPTGEPIRDAAQLALLSRFEALLGPPLRLRREVPLPIQMDLRAWDGRITDGRRTASIEGESKLHDIQAISRRLALKARDDPGAGVVILVVNQTAHNRRIPGGAPGGAAGATSRSTAVPSHRALRAGTVPAAAGIILL